MRCRLLTLLAAVVLLLVLAASARAECSASPCPAAGYTGFPPNQITYHGGPVQHHATVYLVLAGRWKTGDPTVAALLRFYRGVGQSTWGHSLGVYGVRSIHYGGRMTEVNVKTVLGMNADARFAYRAGRRLGVRDWRDAQFEIVPAPGTRLGNLGNTECGEHDEGTVNHTHVFYALILAPVFTASPWSCSGDYAARAGVVGTNAIEGVVSLASHELAETLTDPAWHLGWASEGTGYGTIEIADLCYFYSTEWPQLGNATWLWSPSRHGCYPIAH